jgi:hypothetical protein
MFRVRINRNVIGKPEGPHRLEKRRIDGAYDTMPATDRHGKRHE